MELERNQPIKTCPFCMQATSKFHRRSHIMPEWMYTGMYDENHKMLQASIDRQKLTKKQKGLYASFMCVDCEKESQRYDHYASLVLTGRSPESNEHKTVQKVYHEEYKQNEKIWYSTWQNIRFEYFQKFVFSIALRCHFSGLMKSGITLTEKHLNRILALYKSQNNLDDISYPIQIIEYPLTDPLRNHVVLPYFEKKKGHHVLEFSGSGYLFNVYVSSHEKPRFVKSLRLKKDGSMYVIGMEFRETGLYRNFSKLLKGH